MIRTIHSTHAHFGWDRAIPPLVTVAPGTTLELACRDAFDGQLTRNSTDADVLALDPARANPLTGPVHVDGAEPGDALRVRIEALTPSGLGWTAIIPGFGLLADQFTAPRLQVWSYDATGRQPAAFGSLARIPLAPFPGTLGVAPAAPGPHSVIPPRHVGGNLDVRDLVAGSVLYLPVEVPGALFSIGDTHAAQGDGEVCGTAIESPMSVTVTLDLEKGAAPPAPRYVTPQAAPGSGRGITDATTGIGPDLMHAARDAVAGMIDLLAQRHGIAAEDAYMLASVAGDLRISEIVDAPNWVVSFAMPRAIFD